MPHRLAIDATLPLRRGPLAHAVTYEVTREVAGQVIATLMARVAELDAAGSRNVARQEACRQAAALSARLRGLSMGDEASMQALLHECTALLGEWA